MTSTALELNHHPATALAIEPGQITWDATQLAALGQLGLADAPAGDLSVFLHVSQRTRLDPFARQIYMIGRKENKKEKRNGQWYDNWTIKYTIQTGIEGFRVIRGRAEHDEGIRGILGRPVYYDHEGKEHKIWFQQRPPVAVEMTYTVRDRNGNETPYTSVLRYSEYVQTKEDNGNRVPIAQWATKPVHMLEKCTEADVYRKAFPQDFSGIYLDDAMPQDTPADGAPGGRPRGRVTAGEIVDSRPAPERSASAVPDETPASGPAADAEPGTPPPPDLATSGQLSMIGQRLGKLGVENENRLSTLEKLAGRDLEAATRLTRDEAARIRELLNRCTDDKGNPDRGALVELLATGQLPEAEKAGETGD